MELGMGMGMGVRRGWEGFFFGIERRNIYSKMTIFLTRELFTRLKAGRQASCDFFFFLFTSG